MLDLLNVIAVRVSGVIGLDVGTSLFVKSVFGVPVLVAAMRCLGCIGGKRLLDGCRGIRWLGRKD